MQPQTRRFATRHEADQVQQELSVVLGDLPRGILIGTAIVILIYMIANIGYYHVLSPTRSAKTTPLLPRQWERFLVLSHLAPSLF